MLACLLKTKCLENEHRRLEDRNLDSSFPREPPDPLGRRRKGHRGFRESTNPGSAENPASRRERVDDFR